MQLRLSAHEYAQPRHTCRDGDVEIMPLLVAVEQALGAVLHTLFSALAGYPVSLQGQAGLQFSSRPFKLSYLTKPAKSAT